jgi:chromosome segregation ATPase
MELLALIDSALQKYDLLTVIFVIGLYVWFKHKLNQVHKDVKVVDQAVNNRPEGSMTMSQEVSEIHRKVDVQNNELKHVKDDVSFLKSDITKSRIYNMERFQSLESDINDVKNEICPKKNRR